MSESEKDTVPASHLSMANEDYLEAIWRIALREQSEAVRSVDVAELLGVSKASVNKALSTLKENGYVDPQVADEEACRMEHALSDDTMNRWVHYLEKAGIAVDTV